MYKCMQADTLTERYDTKQGMEYKRPSWRGQRSRKTQSLIYRDNERRKQSETLKGSVTEAWEGHNFKRDSSAETSAQSPSRNFEAHLGTGKSANDAAMERATWANPRSCTKHAQEECTSA